MKHSLAVVNPLPVSLLLPARECRDLEEDRANLFVTKSFSAVIDEYLLEYDKPCPIVGTGRS